MSLYDDNKTSSNRYINQFSPSAGIPLWGHPDIINYQKTLFTYGIAQLLWPIFIWVWWGVGYIPTISSLWNYCALYYIVYVFIWAVNITMSDSRSKKLYTWTLFVNLIVSIDAIFVTCLLLYDIIACWMGTLPLECRDGQFNAVIFFVVTIGLVIITIIAFVANAGIVGKIKESVSYRGVPFIDKYDTMY